MCGLQQAGEFKMNTLASVAFGAVALATASIGFAQPAAARSDVGVYVSPFGIAVNFDRNRNYCGDYWYRRNHWDYCSRFYDNGYGYNYFNGYYSNGYRLSHNDWDDRNRNHDRDDRRGNDHRDNDRHGR
jgi:hypothetical protein